MLPLVRSLQQQILGQNRFILQRCPNCAQPPLVVVVGTAQTADSWSFHIPALSSKGRRSVLVYEPLGLGPHYDATTAPDVSLPEQARRLLQVVEHVFPRDPTNGRDQMIDLAGFSLGGRIAMATAAATLEHTSCCTSIRKLHLTGVALQRSNEGLLELDTWRDLLRRDDMPRFAEAAIRMSYSKVPRNLEAWIKGIRNNHQREGLLALLEQAHDETGPYSVPNLADRIRGCQSSGRIVVGMEDRMAPPKYAAKLAQTLGWTGPLLLDGAHAIPLEAPRAWRTDVLELLDEEE